MLIMLSSAMSTRICAAFSSPDSLGLRASAAILEAACFSCPPDGTLQNVARQIMICARLGGSMDCMRTDIFEAARFSYPPDGDLHSTPRETRRHPVTACALAEG